MGMSFTRLWLRKALLRTPGVADSVSGFVGIVVSILLHYFPAWGSKVNSLLWEIPIGAFFSVAAFRLLLAPYWIWREDQETINDLTANLKEANNRRPKFSLEINGVMSADVSNGMTGAIVIAYIRVRNSGEPSIAENWGALLKNPNGAVIPGHLLHYKKPQEIGGVILDSENVIYDKTSTIPIPSGAAQGGYLVYFVDGAHSRELLAPGSWFSVICQDVTGTEYTAAWNTKDPRPDHLMYLPGSGMKLKEPD